MVDILQMSTGMILEQYDFTAQSRSTAAIRMVLHVCEIVMLTAARGMHEFFQIWDLLSMQICTPKLCFFSLKNSLLALLDL